MGLADDLNAIKDQLDKAKGEIVGKIGSLEDAIAAAGNVDPNVSAALAAVKEAAQALDDVVADAPVAPVEPVADEGTVTE